MWLRIEQILSAIYEQVGLPAKRALGMSPVVQEADMAQRAWEKENLSTEYCPRLVLSPEEAYRQWTMTVESTLSELGDTLNESAA